MFYDQPDTYLNDIEFVGDLDRDGFDDLVLADWNADILVFRGSATGPTRDGTLSIDEYAETIRVVAGGDVNGDGYSDVVGCVGLTEAPWAELRVWSGSANGLSAPARIALPEAIACVGLAVGNFDGDGDDDVAVGLDHGWAAWYRGSSTGLEPTYARKFRPVAGDTVDWVADAGDVNADGFDDLVSYGEKSAVLFYGSSYGPFAQNSTVFGDDDYQAGIGVGDLDGDGFGDVALGRMWQDGDVAWYRGEAGSPGGSPDELDTGVEPDTDPLADTDEPADTDDIEIIRRDTDEGPKVGCMARGGSAMLVGLLGLLARRRR